MVAALDKLTCRLKEACQTPYLYPELGSLSFPQVHGEKNHDHVIYLLQVSPVKTIACSGFSDPELTS